MKTCVTELSGRITPYNTQRKVSLLALTLILFVIIHLLKKNSQSPLISPYFKTSHVRGISVEKKCDIFSGKWVPHPEGPNYSNDTCHLMIDQHNCMKLGRPDKEYMNWRWKPDECELPVFNPAQFFKLVRGKSMAFVGDSVGRNQMQSLLCLLSSVAYPEDISHKYSTNTDYFKRYFYADYRFTVATIWSPFLVESKDADPNGHTFDSLMDLYLDKADESWVSEVENFDYVIVSAGQWFFRPLIYKENNQVIGCHKCYIENMTAISKYYGYRMAFRTAFRTLQSLKNYKGITFLRTFSPSHFENGDWNKGGNCARTRPFTSQEMKLEGFVMEFYLTQVEELRAAEKEGIKRGLKFRLLDTTEIMLLRPDGHPNRYGQSPHKNVAVNDCVHWCLPGPVDAWNEFLLYMMKTEGQGPFEGKI
ncbi:protein trichome birefringence-like 19 [Mangifera indica]|uniref:protein trichome birefringence-like 19 n=1 Tax=Mangifera indica TaxID=29780 RepID=UPI001CF968B3|nr:protein trichome birefringence-like 19 [Mangifera indica]